MGFFNRKIWLYAFLASGSVFALTLAGGKIAKDNSAALNKALGITTTVKDGDGPVYFPIDYGEDDAAKLKADIQKVAEQVESEGLVLLQNKDNALPLLEGHRKISLIGTASYTFNYNTSGSSSTSSEGYPVLDASLAAAGFDVNPAPGELYRSDAIKNSYGRFRDGQDYKINEAPWSAISDAVKSSLENYGDAVIMTLARNSGEGSDLNTAFSDGEDESYLALSNEELGILKELTTLKSQGKIKKIIVLLNASNPIEVDFLFRDDIDVDATLWIGNVGAYGMNALGPVLNGSVNPSGRLSDTFCRDNFSSPAMTSWAFNRQKLFTQGYKSANSLGLKDDMLATVRNYGVYNEGIYVGYRYYETRYADKVLNRANVGDFNYDDVVGFPFGHGLSYGEFSYSNFAVEEKENEFVVSVKVTNNSATYEGKHAVEVYLNKPYTAYDIANGVEKSFVELVGFEKTSSLAPAASETLTISIPRESLKTYDANKAKTYILEDGDYNIVVGKDAHDAAKNVLAAQNALAEGNASLVQKFNVASFDAETYSKSRQTGEAITNQLDHADPNKYEGLEGQSVTYVSRNNWTGTFPAAKNDLDIKTDKMKEDLGSHKALPVTDDLMPTYGKQTSLTAADLRDASWDDPRWDELVDAMSFAEQSFLVTNGQMVTSTAASVGLPESSAADGPTAVTETKTASSFPSEGIWASTFNKDLIEQLGKMFALDARYADIQGMYAPGVNIHRSPFNGRSNEYFSEDPYLSGIMAAKEIKGLQGQGVLAYVKHFAFNDQETNRNGVCTWLNEQSAREIYLLPFEIACSEDMGYAHAIMSSFNRVGCLWAGADSGLQINILQKEWGYHGFIITDMAVSNGGTYMVFDDGIISGTNLYLRSGSKEALDAYSGNAAFCLKVRDSAKRIIYNVARFSAAMNGVSGAIGEVAPWYETLLNGLSIGTGILGGISLCLSIASLVFLRRKP